MVLSLMNKDKVSAGTQSFNAVLEEESAVIPSVYSKASYLLQHMQKKMSQHLLLQDGGNLPVLGIVPWFWPGVDGVYSKGVSFS